MLTVLSEVPLRRSRIGDLALTTSLPIRGTTRLVSRLADEGRVERRPCEDDGRGFERRERAYPTHLAGARRRVMDHLGGVDLDPRAGTLSDVGEGTSGAFGPVVPVTG